MKLSEREWKTLCDKNPTIEPERLPAMPGIKIRVERKVKSSAGHTTTVLIESETKNLYDIEKLRDYLESIGFIEPLPITQKIKRMLGFSPILG